MIHKQVFKLTPDYELRNSKKIIWYQTLLFRMYAAYSQVCERNTERVEISRNKTRICLGCLNIGIYM